MSKRETVLILDYGSQYTQLIARRCREEGVYSWIEAWNISVQEVREIEPVGIILSGGPLSVYDDGAPDLNPELLTLDVPVLGICYGMYLLVKVCGGEVTGSTDREYGRASIDITVPGKLLKGLNPVELVWMSHGDKTAKLPENWNEIAISNSGIVAAIENNQRNLYGVQFHPEVSHTPSGDKILKNFLYDICGSGGGWNMAAFAKQATTDIAEKIGDGRALCAMSGGVDSSVAATLVSNAIGDRLTCVFVDNGLMRKNEAIQVEKVFRPRFGDGLKLVNAGESFLKDLHGVTDPEKKRKLIGHRFINVFRREASSILDCNFLVQGTLYPDVIESSGTRGVADVIKTHHNVGGLPEELGLSLVEPLRDLFKDEVRQVGRELGLPDHMVMRHPFPGPGLAVRIIGEVNQKSIKIVQEADAIFIEELVEAGWYGKVSQALVVLLPVKSVGVKGDARTYEQVVVLRSVDTRDFMTADFSPIPFELLAKISSRITNEVSGVNRVVYDITSKPPGTVEWE